MLDGRIATIVVIAHNQEKFARQALASVLGQSHPNLECIFVDDGSTDRTSEEAASLAASDTRLQLYRTANNGPCAARNFGASKKSAHSEFIGFLDGDDVFLPNHVKNGIAYLDRNPIVDVVVPSFNFIDADGSVTPTSPRRRWAPRFLGLPGLIPYSEPATPFVTFYCGSGFPMWLARTAAYERLDGWDLNLWPYEDTDILCQFANAGVVHTIPDVLVMWRQHAQQSTRSGAQRTCHWKPGALKVMQEKWNAKANLNAKQAKVVDAACWYFRQIHLPLRDIYVARKALPEFLNDPSVPRLKWLAFLIASFFKSFFYYKIFFWRARRTWPAAARR